jgi:hypothetical protein
MPPFAIIAHDRADAGTLRADTRPAHLDHLATIGDRVDRAGPMLDAAGVPIGSLVIAEFDDLPAAEAFVRDDPYARTGLFDRVTVTAWRRVLP